MNRIKLIQIIIDVIEKYIFYPKLRKFYKSRHDILDPIIIDVGSNRGQSIDFFTGIYKQATIYSFEPNITLFENLIRKYNSNKKICIENIGISSTKGELIFKVNAMDETSTFEELNYDSKYLDKKLKVLGIQQEEIIKEKYPVKVNTLANVFKQKNINKVDILKVDVEGHELDCLLGLFSNDFCLKPKYIQLESHYDDMYVNAKNYGEIKNLLIQNGYKELNRIKHSFGDFDEVVFHLVEL